MAYSIMIGYKEGSIFNIPSKCIEGKPEGIFPLNSHLILKISINDATTSATNVLGIAL
jgi:hypothetical protein